MDDKMRSTGQTPGQAKEEIRKCRESLAHFYNNYLRNPEHPELTDEDFERFKSLLEQQRIKTRNSDPAYREAFFRKYPITEFEAFPKSHLGACMDPMCPQCGPGMTHNQ